VHDFYRRFVKKNESEQHYVRAGRLATVLLFVLSSSLVFFLQTAQDSFNIILQIGAGTGMLYLLRWFWWRISAWCEIVAMTASFLAAAAFLWLHHAGIEFGTHKELVMGIAFTTLCWVVTAYVGPRTDEATLVAFYRRVHPIGPGWTYIRSIAHVDPAQAAAYAREDNVPLAMLGWVSGCATIWSGLFMVGNFLYGRMDYFYGLLAIFVVMGLALIGVIRRLWE
jgi:hypothetical protein